jgi:hypothetical protein
MNDVCPTCQGMRWVCEAHADTPWLTPEGEENCCGGAGMPCRTCNPLGEQSLPGALVVWKVGSYVH